MYAQLDARNAVIAVHRAKPISIGIGDDMIQYPRSIFTLWSDQELNAIGYARFNELRPSPGMVSLGAMDTFADGKITRTHTVTHDPDYLDKQKANRNRQIKNHRDSIRDAGIEWSPDDGVTSYVVQTDGDSRRELTGAIVGLNESGATEQAWRMQDNMLVVLSAEVFKAMALAVSVHVNACYVHQAVLENTISTTTDIAELNAIDVETGWPPHYIAEGM